MNTKELLEFIGHKPTEYLIAKIEHHFEINHKNVKQVSLEAVFTYIAYKHQVQVSDLQGKSHQRVFAIPRQEGSWLASRLGYKLVDIASFLKKNHSTIIYGRKTIDGLYDIDKKYREELERDLTFLRVQDETNS